MAWTITAFFDILNLQQALLSRARRCPDERGAGVLAAGFEPRLTNNANNIAGTVSFGPTLTNRLRCAPGLCCGAPSEPAVDPHPAHLDALQRQAVLHQFAPLCTTLHHFAVISRPQPHPPPYPESETPAPLLTHALHETSGAFKVIQDNSKEFKGIQTRICAPSPVTASLPAEALGSCLVIWTNPLDPEVSPWLSAQSAFRSQHAEKRASSGILGG
jgi:hypothetical protein